MKSVAVLVGFFGIWAVLHSLVAARSVKARARRTFGEHTVARWYRLVYNVVATVTFVPFLLLLARLPDRILYVVPTPWRWVMFAGQFLAAVGLIATLRQTDVWHFLGLAQLVREKPTEEPSTLQVDGFYRWVRHPLYTFSLLLLWLTPIMTVNVLTSYLAFTLYFYAGSIHEERRLVAEFGDAYRAYRRDVPRLIPRLPLRRTAHSESS